jgi:uncharacterized protein YcbK (DUF882 family)
MISLSLVIFLAALSPLEVNDSIAVNDNPQLTKSFRINDFHVGCVDKIPRELFNNLCILAQNLQIIQDHIKKPIRIISGYRSPKCNRRVRGAKKSQHMNAMAADIRVRGMSMRRLKRVIEGLIKDQKILQGGVGLYKSHVHYDIRGDKARWRKTKHAEGICK